jgi:hypothetical protein
MPYEPRRDVFWNGEFEAQLAGLIPDEEEAGEFVAGAEDLLSRKPELGSRASDDGTVWSIPMTLLGERELWLLYSFDESRVVLLAVVLA